MEDHPEPEHIESSSLHPNVQWPDELQSLVHILSAVLDPYVGYPRQMSNIPALARSGVSMSRYYSLLLNSSLTVCELSNTSGGKKQSKLENKNLKSWIKKHLSVCSILDCSLGLQPSRTHSCYGFSINSRIQDQRLPLYGNHHCFGLGILFSLRCKELTPF